MSVIVKGMDMPKNCAYCPLSEYRNTSLGQILDCKRIGTVGSAVRDTHDVLNRRHPNCPLVDSPEPHWIPVTERLPEEEDSIFARYYGTDRWRKSMFRKKSREVIVTSVFEDGELHTEVAHTTDGEWHVGVNVVPRTVIAWMPLPEPFKGVTE